MIVLAALGCQPLLVMRKAGARVHSLSRDTRCTCGDPGDIFMGQLWKTFEIDSIGFLYPPDFDD